MMDWWNVLSLELQIFYGMAIVSTGILVVQLLLLLVGGDTSSDLGDAGDLDVSHPSGLSVLSVRTVIAFLAGFGWTGVIALKSGMGIAAAVVVAGAVGLALMFMVYYLMRMLFGLRYSGTLDYANAVGAVADVYVSIPSDRSGPGQVQVVVQGRTMTVRAITGHGEPIQSGTKVRVVKLVDDRTLLVEPLGD